MGRNIEVETLDWGWHVIQSTTLMTAIAIAGAFPSIASGTVTKSGYAAHAEAAPATIVARGDHLMESRRRVRSGDPLLMPAYRQLIKSADSALQIAPVSVMQKSKVPPSGDKHDFMSLAPYWWPDSSKANGLPYIRRDGVINPESRLDHDGLRFQAMGDAVNALAMAYYFTGDEKYAAKAATLLRVFFIDPATRMNPNLNFAQAVPGVTPGRGTGLIDTRNIPQLVDAIRLLRPSRSLRASEYDALVKWSADYLTWLRTSKNGKDERAADNNHGTWYDAQAAALALFVGDTSFARQVIGTDARARIAAHISPNGSQPRELARTRPIHYSLFNLDPYTQLAEMGRLVGTDLWNYTAPKGGSLRAALYFIAPYTDSTLKWSTPEATPLTAEDFATPLLRAASSLHDARLARALASLDESVRTSRERLLYPELPTSNASERDAADKATIRFAEQRLESSATRLDPTNGYPRATKSDGTWEQRPANAWTSGFFAGTLWYVYELTRDDKWKRLAERWTTELEPDKTLRTTHDLGFMIFDSFGHAYLLTGDAHDSAVVIEAARNLATRYDARVGAIKSWDTDSVTDARRGWKYPVIIDNMMNLPLLFWGSSHGGDSTWRQMAISHAIRTAEAQLRRDGSTAHVALFDPATGKLLRTTTWQGYSDSSVWARGQAWAIHGFASAYGSTRRPELLQAAERSADFFLANLPDDGVPPWDFRIPDRKHAERDASAAAIAASGLLDLARWAPEPARSRYANAADHIIASLEKNYLSTDRRGDAILQHSVGGLPQKSEVDVGLVYADYYFLEALVRRRGIFLE